MLSGHQSKNVIKALLIATACLSAQPLAISLDADSLFQAKCAGCHSIGGGALVGPDLAPTAGWSSVDLAKAVKGMEKSVGPLTNEEVDSLVEFLRRKKDKGTQSTAQAKPATNVEVTVAPEPNAAKEPASAAKGKQLFSGAEALKNGGLSCIACHHVDDAGGTLGTDLSTVSDKMANQALITAIEHAPYKVMKTAYKDHPVTHQEAVDLAAYFQSLKEPHKKMTDAPVSLIGFIVAALVFGVIAIGYRNRNTSVRAKLNRRD